MKLYLAGPMRGIPEYNFPAFDLYAGRLRREGHIVFSPADGDRWLLLSTGREPDARECFALDTQWLCREADGIVLMPGWENSLGAKAEKALAEAIGLPVTEL